MAHADTFLCAKNGNKIIRNLITGIKIAIND